MLKKKYLHRKGRKYGYEGYYIRGKKYKNKNLLFTDLPFHERMRKEYYSSNYDLTPLYEFVNSKIGENWNDVYSEILTKIKKKFRHIVDENLIGRNYYAWIIKRPIYDENFIPRDERGRMLKDTLFIDNDNIIVKKSEEEILKDSIKYLRRKKIQEILENQEKEQSNQIENIEIENIEN